ncbi:hypothetical protein [Bacillus thuringiensis]|nr:hypothetical protein [Bacillus thuringiensis]MED3275367.1 hypothetical protein [Bacillus thuringiensis]
MTEEKVLELLRRVYWLQVRGRCSTEWFNEMANYLHKTNWRA